MMTLREGSQISVTCGLCGTLFTSINTLFVIDAVFTIISTDFTSLLTATAAGAVILGQMGEHQHQRSKQIQTLMRRNTITLLEEIQQLVWV